MNRIDDIRDVLGMRTIWAFILIGLFAAMQLTATFASYEDGQLLWVLLVEWCIYTAALVGVALLPGDPLPLRSKIFLVTAGPIATAIGYSQVQVPQTEALQGAFTTSVVAYLTFTCVRGAIGWAWLAFTGSALVVFAWGLTTGQGVMVGVVFVLTNVAPMLMATFFGRTIRPTTQSILLLREQSNMRAASEAAAIAAVQERDEQLDRLDAVARPMLDVIASGRALTPAEQAECCLLEAELRDRLRGGDLVDAAVSAAARAARTRGVMVVLLDDGGLAGAEPAIAETVRETVVSALAQMSDGSVSARVLPPGRPHLLAIVGRRDDGEFHVGVSADGVVRSDVDRRIAAQ